MRIMPSTALLHGRRHLRRFVKLGGGAALLASAGCAKFPPPGTSNSNFTQVTFSMTVQRQVNINYNYFVAITASPLVNPPPQGAPQPVFDPSKNPNGFVAGSPTHYVMFNAANENIQPFQLYRFALQSEIPNPSDPTNPINLKIAAPSTRGVITNFQPVNAGTNSNPGTSTTLQFTLFVNLLGDTDVQAQALQTLQVQFLNMNTTQATSSRVIDFLGTRGTPNFQVVDLRTSNQYSSNSGGVQPTGDCPDPDVGIQSWSISVTPAG